MFAQRLRNTSRGNYLRLWIYIFLLSIFCFFIFIFGIGRWDLWNPDEPRYAQVSREIIEKGDWILMHLNGRVYGDKPPLFFWLIAISSYLWNGFNSFSARFPSAFFGTLTVFLTFLLGKKLYSIKTGFLSGLILMTSIEFAYLSTRANIDTTLTFFTTFSLYSFYLWHSSQREERDGQHRTRDLFLLVFYISMAFATLTKGPVGFIIPLMVSIIYLLVKKDFRALREMRLLYGMLLFICIVLSWYIPAVLKGGDLYLKETLLKHTAYAYVKGWTHVKPIHYYLYNFPLDFFPWVLFLPGALILIFLKAREKDLKDYLFLLIWFSSIFIFFSFSKGKRPIYLLPLYPAASILVGEFWNFYLSSSNHNLIKPFISWPIKFLVVTLFLIGILPLLISIQTDFPIEPTTQELSKSIIKWTEMGEKYLSFIPEKDLLILSIFFIGSSFILFISQINRGKLSKFIIIFAIFGFGFFYATRTIFPVINPYKSARFLSQEINQLMKPGERLAIYGGLGTGPYNFYTGIVPIIELNSDEELLKFFSLKERIFCLFEFKDFENISKKYVEIPFHIISERRVGDDHIVFVSNQ